MYMHANTKENEYLPTPVVQPNAAYSSVNMKLFRCQPTSLEQQ